MLRPMPAYFLVSIPRKEQSTRKERIGSLYLHPNFVYMTRGMQCGQVVGIGSLAAEAMPEARIGDTLLIHHFVESTEKQFCVYSDPYFNYYVVTCKSHNGQNNQTYGLYNGSRIIPHPEYIFLDCKQPKAPTLSHDEYIEAAIQQRKSGIFTFKEWNIDREAISKQIQELKSQIDQLTKTRMNPELAKAIEAREAEMNRLSKMLTHQQFDPYTVQAVSPLFSNQVREHYGYGVAKGDNIYMLNIACETKMEFNKIEYIVAKTQHFGLPAQLVRDQFKTARKSLSF